MNQSRTLHRLVAVGLCICASLALQATASDTIIKSYVTRQLEDLECTMALLPAEDGSLVGVIVTLRNLSATADIPLRRPAGRTPFAVTILHGGCNPLNKRGLLSVSTGDCAASGEIAWTLKPGESSRYFLPVAKLFDEPLKEERIEGCTVYVYVSDIYPPPEMVEAARHRKLTANDYELRLPGIDTIFRCGTFKGVALTRKGLQEDVDKIYAAATRDLPK